MLEKNASMHICNLVETIHHKWHAMSGKNGVNMFKAIIGDLVGALVQQYCYSKFLKSGITRKEPNKLELLLRVGF